MVAAPSQLSSFRRTFALLMLLVVLPSAGLSAFGVLAIVNERAAVEKRLRAYWLSQLQALAAQVPAALPALAISGVEGGGLRVTGQDGEPLSDGSFLVDAAGALRADPPGLLAVLGPDATALAAVEAGPSAYWPASDGGAYAVRREGAKVRGAHVPGTRLVAILEGHARLPLDDSSKVRPLLAPARRLGTNLVERLMFGMAEARDALGQSALAELTLPAPLENFRLLAVASGEDPIARASLRNRALYALLLGALYLVLALGILLTARTLYREAKLSRLKTDFVSLVSHELRTPLTSVRLFIETLAMGRVKDEAQTREVLQLLAKETQRLSQLIERVLDWSRIESGKREYRPEPVSVQGLIDDALEAFRAQRLDVPVDLRCEVAPGLPELRVDRAALADALLNLLQNAFKYTGTDKRIALRATAAGKHVEIEVEDNGVGIPQRERKRIFEHFFRIDNLLTRKTEGSGLGLAIAKRVVEAHGGRIFVRSEVGRGSCFTVQLPAHAVTEGRAA